VVRTAKAGEAARRKVRRSAVRRKQAGRFIENPFQGGFRFQSPRWDEGAPHLLEVRGETGNGRKGAIQPLRMPGEP
jgi:hypothetical protein